ncbi:MAG: nucleotide exchange factor GrpE [Candidatus Limnocylindria bacterium]
MADERARRAEELLEERLGTRRNGEDREGTLEPEAVTAETGTAERDRAEELTRDLQRLAADFANYRRRNEAERNDFARFAKADLITRLLEVLDDYDRALGTVPEDLGAQPWVEGMWLVERKLRDILASEGLEPIETVGKAFDPYVHESIAHVDADAPEGSVVDEVRKGYRLHDRVIRPALVTVAKQKES